jgi:hypothetical protein
MELVASFVNRSNLLKSWEKTDIYAVSPSRAPGPKNTVITRMPAHVLPRSRMHFSDHTALVVPVQPVKTGITLPLAIPSHRQEREKGLLRRAERLHERQ